MQVMGAGPRSAMRSNNCRAALEQSGKPGKGWGRGDSLAPGQLRVLA